MRSANHLSRALLVAAVVIGPAVATAAPASAYHELSMARNDSYSTPIDVPLVVPAPGLLANDDNSYGGIRVDGVQTAPAHGTLTVSPDGSFSYTPEPGFTGDDSFTYRANDSIGTPSNVATVSLRVGNPPVANEDAYSLDEDSSLVVAAPGVLADDTDADGSPLTAQLVTAPQHGTVVLGANGSLTYTPVADFNGMDSFTYRASDGTWTSSPVTVSLTVAPVNDVPVPVADAYAVAGGTPLTVAAPGLVANDVDVDGDPLAVYSYMEPANGYLTLMSSGAFTYRPDAGFRGTDTFTYNLLEGSWTSPMVTVTFTVGNTAPVAVDDAWDVVEDQRLDEGDVLGNDSDANTTDSLTASLVSGPAHGSLTLNANGTFAYDPEADFHGTDSFTYRASDGTDVSGTATVTLTVDPAPDAPVVADEAVSIVEDSVLESQVDATDVDGDALTYRLVVEPQEGTVVLDEATGEYTYTPDADATGTDQLGFEACDPLTYCGAGLVTITITPVDDAPVVSDETLTTAEDTTTATLLTVTDPDSWDFVATVVTAPAHGQVTLDPSGSDLTYTPDADWVGTDVVEISVCDDDGLCGTATITVVVTAVADPPVVTGTAVVTAEDTPVDGQVTVSDPDSTVHTVSVSETAARGTVEARADGSFTYTPGADVTGSDSFTLEVCDADGLCGSAEVEVSITAVNDTPVVEVPGGSRPTGRVGTPVVVEALASDTEQGLLSVGWNQTAGPRVAFGPQGSTLRFTPEVAGSYSFQVVACDAQQLCGSQTVTVRVAGASVPPATDTPAGSGLATTGAETAVAGLASMLLLAVGGGLVAVRRRAARA